MRRSLQAAFSLLAVGILLSVTAGTSSAHGSPGLTFMKVRPAHQAKSARPHHSNLLYSHGGAVETRAAVYVVYWGAQWSGFTTGGFTSAQAQGYVQGFFNGVGGTAWANSTTQYCQGVVSGTTQCGSAGVHPSNPSSELAGAWTDAVALPSNITQSSIAAEAQRAATHFGYNVNANYMVFTPTGHSMSGFATSWCAWHSSTTSAGGSLSYSYMPYQPDAGTSCGMSFVNGGSSGYFDGFSIVGGHEYAETVTDPFPNTGWLDGSGAENGDKCAWISSGQGAAADITLNGGKYAVQSLWSNAFNTGLGGCVLSY